MTSKKSLGALRCLQRSAEQKVRTIGQKGLPLPKEEVDIRYIIDNKLTGVIPLKFNFARDVVDHWARKEASFERSRHLPALHIVNADSSKERQINYTELSQLSKQLAGVFVNQMGLSRKDRILISLPKCAEFWIIIVAALRAGIEFTSVTPQAVGHDFRYRISEFQPSLVISDNTGAINYAVDYPSCPVRYKMCVNVAVNDPRWLQLENEMQKCQSPYEAADTNSHDPAMVFFTSGTTGAPKMVQHTYAYTLAHMTSDTNLFRLNNSDRLLCTADTGWAKTAFGTYPAFTAGAGIMIDTSSRFNPRHLLKVLEHYPATKLNSAPTVYRMILKENELQFRFKSLEAVYSGGEPLSSDAFNQWKKLTGLEIREGYGQSETMMLCTGNPDFPAKPGSMGLPAPEFDVNVLDDNYQPAAVNEVGHFAIRIKPDHPMGLFIGYKNNPEKTAAVFSGDYYLTGDKVYRDHDNYYWFVSRTDDIITSSGYRIGPFEVETVLLQHPAVLEAAVVASPDKDRVEVVKAYIVLREEYRLTAGPVLKKEIQDFAKKLTAPYKYPRKLEFLTELPKTTSGKIQRHVLRAATKIDS